MRLRENHSAQLHVIEAFIGVMLLLNALAYIGSLSAPATKGTHAYNELGMEARDALRAAASTENETGGPMLTEWLVTGNRTALTGFLNRTLPATSAYRITVADAETSQEVYSCGTPFEGAVVAHRYLVTDQPPAGFTGTGGPVYMITIVLWYL